MWVKSCIWNLVSRHVMTVGWRTPTSVHYMWQCLCVRDWVRNKHGNIWTDSDIYVCLGPFGTIDAGFRRPIHKEEDFYVITEMHIEFMPGSDLSLSTGIHRALNKQAPFHNHIRCTDQCQLQYCTESTTYSLLWCFPTKHLHCRVSIRWSEVERITLNIATWYAAAGLHTHRAL